MSIKFHFQPQKAIQAMAFLADAIGPVEKVKLMKLMYLADKAHFLKYGYPITGDRLCALRWGPIPSRCLKMLNGEPLTPADSLFRYIHIDDNLVIARRSPDLGILSDSEVSVLRGIAQQHGGKYRWKLVRETHELPEYVEAYVENTSRPISYETIAKHSGDERRFRQNRPVIDSDMAAFIDCPVGPADGDL